MRNRHVQMFSSSKQIRRMLDSFEPIKSGKVVCLTQSPSEITIGTGQQHTFSRTSDGAIFRKRVREFVKCLCLECCNLNRKPCQSGLCFSCHYHHNRHEVLEQTRGSKRHCALLVALTLGVHFGIVDISFKYNRPGAQIGQKNQRSMFSARIRSHNIVISVDPQILHTTMNRAEKDANFLANNPTSASIHMSSNDVRSANPITFDFVNAIDYIISQLDYANTVIFLESSDRKHYSAYRANLDALGVRYLCFDPASLASKPCMRLAPSSWPST